MPRGFAPLLLVGASLAWAQPSPHEFPEGSTPVAADALKASLTNKVFAVRLASGQGWRWQFNSVGHFHLNMGTSSDTGKWEVKGSSLCIEGRQIKAICNEVRAKGTQLYLKRDNGEVVKLEAQ